ncbi:MAG: hypothetical protein IIY55_05790, partial [Blautia sp.]|nr:hypothetical protein [Blautia sp.]
MICNRRVYLRSLAASLFFCLLALCAFPVFAEEGEAGEEAVVSDENLFNKSDPYFIEGYNFIQTSDQITIEPDSFITGFIPVESGDVVRVNLNSTQNTDFFKYALFDANRTWQDTVRVSNASEMTIRIFDPGFVRISVFGLDFEETITIFISKTGQGDTNRNRDTMVMSQNNSNVVVKTSEEDESVFYTDWFDRSDPDVLDRFNFAQTTGTIVEEPSSFITGYIQVSTGDAVTLALNGNKPSAFVKYALYNKDKIWQKTYKLNNISETTITIDEPGFVRFSAYGRFFKNSAAVYIHPSLKLAADQQIEEQIIPGLNDVTGQVGAFNSTYFSQEIIEMFDRNSKEFLMDQGFSQLTGEIVNDEGSFLTGYIPVVNGQVLVISITQASAFAKYAMYDLNKNWISTTRVDNPTMLVIPITQTGFLRFHGYGKAIEGTSITIPSVTKLDINQISGNIATRLERLEESTETSSQVDVVIFMGQSNMAGRGSVTDEYPEDAPAVIDGAGWEFRAISDPTKLYPIDKLFGKDENQENAIDDTGKKTGSLVPAFVNSYYSHNGKVPVVCVSASEGATSIRNWKEGTERLKDAVKRLNKCVKWLQDNHYEIRHQYMVWCQGESDASHSEKWYTSNFENMFAKMQEAGIE